MGFTSRRKRPINRQIPHLRDTRLIIIVTEGQKTEKQYFESDIFCSPRLQVIISPSDSKSAPHHVYERLKRIAKEHELQPDDHFWFMIDKDRWPEKELAKICQNALKCKKINIGLAVSNPCFELWLYLDHQDWTSGSVNSRDMEVALKNLLGCYNKSNINILKYINGITKAIERAETLDSFNPDVRWPENPGTHVYKVVKQIHQIIGRKPNQ